VQTRQFNKNIRLEIENFIASLIYDMVNGLLTFLQYFLSSFRKSTRAKAIILFRTGGVGDMVCAIPAFRALRKHFLGARLILLTKREPVFGNSQSFSRLLGNDILDKIIYYKSDDLKSLRKIYSLMIYIRKEKIDKMIYLGQYDVTLFRLLRDMLFFYFSGCRELYGFRLNKHRLFRIAQCYYRVFDSEAERLLKLLVPLGISQKNLDFNLSITEEDKRSTDILWPNSTALQGRPKVAINPGAKMPLKRWSKENFLQLSRALIDKYNAFIVLIGGEDTEGSCRFIKNNLGENCLNLCAKTNFMQTAQVLSRCDLMISCDSGPVHLAAAVKTPVVGIYTARDYPNCWSPYGRNHTILRHNISCQVCLKTDCSTMSCINGISVEEVISACSPKLLHN